MEFWAQISQNLSFFSKTGITSVPMDQIAKFVRLNISTFICPSAGINKSVKNKIWILDSRGQTFFFAPKYPHFSLKITKTVFSQNFPKVWFNGQRMWDHTYMDDHYQLSNLLIRKISCGRYARGAWPKAEMEEVKTYKGCINSCCAVCIPGKNCEVLKLWFFFFS